ETVLPHESPDLGRGRGEGLAGHGHLEREGAIAGGKLEAGGAVALHHAQERAVAGPEEAAAGGAVTDGRIGLESPALLRVATELADDAGRDGEAPAVRRGDRDQIVAHLDVLVGEAG